MVSLVPGPDRVVVQQQNLGDRLTAHAVVQQHQRVGPTSKPVRSRAVPSKLDQVLAGFRGQGSRRGSCGGADSGESGFARGFLQILAESQYIALVQNQGDTPPGFQSPGSRAILPASPQSTHPAAPTPYHAPPAPTASRSSAPPVSQPTPPAPDPGLPPCPPGKPNSHPPPRARPAYAIPAAAPAGRKR